MSSGNRQGRPKTSRGPRTVRPDQPRNIATNHPQVVYANQQFTQVQPQLQNMENVVVYDNSVLIPQPQYLVRHPTTPRNTQGNVQILQDIAIPAPVTSNNGNRRPPLHAMTSNTNTVYAHNIQNIQKPVRFIPPSSALLPPGGRFVTIPKTCVPAGMQPLEQVQLQPVTSQVSILHDNRGQGSTTGLVAGQQQQQQQQQNRSPMMTLKDYPEYTMTMHDFTNTHKNMMFHMSSFMHGLFHPIVECNAYVLTVSVNYGQILCFEVEAKILGDFICRLIPCLLEWCQVPFALELKDAPSNWSMAMKKSVVIGQKNYELAAKKIAECLGTRKVVLPEKDKLPDLLNAQFKIRRSFMGIKFSIGKKPANLIFEDLAKRIRIVAKSKESVQEKAEVSTQTIKFGVLTAGLWDQHKMQLDMVTSSQMKRNYRDVIQSDQVQNLEVKHRVQLDLIEGITKQAEQMVNNRQPKPTVKVKTEFGYLRSKEVQTDPAPVVPGYEQFVSPPSDASTTDDYLDLVAKIAEYSAKHYKQIQNSIQKLEQENSKLRADISKKRSSISKGSHHRESRDSKSRDGHDKKSDANKSLKDHNRDDKDDKKMEHKSRGKSRSRHDGAGYKYEKQPTAAEYLDGFKQILVEQMLPTLCEVKTEQDDPFMLYDSDMPSVGSFCKLNDADLMKYLEMPVNMNPEFNLQSDPTNIIDLLGDDDDIDFLAGL